MPLQSENHKTRFLKREKNSNVKIISLGIYVLIGLLLVVSGTTASFQKDDRNQQTFTVLLLILFFINGCVGLGVLSVDRFIKDVLHKYSIGFISVAHIVTNSILVGMLLFCGSYSGSCIKEWDCDHDYDSHSLPLETLIFAMMTPLLYSFLFPHVSWKVSVVSWMVVLVWIAVTIGVFDAYNVIYAFILYVGFSMMILLFTCEQQRQYVYLFLEKEQCEQDILRVVEQSEKHAKDIHNTLSNVVHDLKTPMSISKTGVGNIEIAVKECQTALQNGRFDMQVCCNSIQTIAESAKHIKTVSDFMLGSVNRFLEYSKAQEGLKLTAKYDTICLANTLLVPKLYAHTIPPSLQIEFLPYNDQSICTHMVTDEAWLQENLLCLLSNAVKYSEEGLITVSLSLVEVEVLPEHHQTNNNNNNNNNNQNCYDEHHAINNRKDDSKDGGIPSSRLSQGMEWLQATGKKMMNNSKVGVIPIDDIETNSSAAPFGTRPFHSMDSLVGIVATGEVAHTSTRSAASSRKMSFNHSKRSQNDLMKRRSINSVDDSNILVSHVKLNSMLFFEVEDEGIGISEEKMKQLFCPFQQAQRHAGGTGLGLFSLANRVEALNGFYGVRARKDGKQGSSFWFAIPYKPDLATAKHTLKQKSKNISSACLADLHNNPPTAESEPNAYESLLMHQSFNNTIAATYTNHTGHQRQEGDIISATLLSDIHISANEKLITHSFDEYDDLESAQQQMMVMTTTITSESERTAAEASSVKIPFLDILNILLVDDSSTILKMVSGNLSKHGHTVTEALNGSNALKKVEAVRSTPRMRPFDVIIVDLQMPVMDGIEFTKRLRKNELDLMVADPTLKIHQIVMLCSAHCDDETLDLAHEAGIDATLEKPLELLAFYDVYSEITNRGDNYYI